MENDNPQVVGSFDTFPKASIGNYKGVMLCNRPNEFGQQRRPEPTGPQPFKSRVTSNASNPVGWNPCEKVYPKSNKKKNLFANVLNRHKAFLKNLETQKALESEEKAKIDEFEENKIQSFKINAEKQRKKIKEMKETKALLAAGDEMVFEEQ